MIDAANIDTEELLRYCLGINPDDLGNSRNGNRMYIATCGKIIISVGRGEMEHMVAVSDAIEGKIGYLDNFHIDEDVIITNYIHGTYYPTCEAFEHIDFSVNQYSREIFEAKYSDAEKITGVSIGAYGNLHYKIWCVRGENLGIFSWRRLAVLIQRMRTDLRCVIYSYPTAFTIKPV